jgi:hypothetical protein
MGPSKQQQLAHAQPPQTRTQWRARTCARRQPSAVAAVGGLCWGSVPQPRSAGWAGCGPTTMNTLAAPTQKPSLLRRISTQEWLHMEPHRPQALHACSFARR